MKNYVREGNTISDEQFIEILSIIIPSIIGFVGVVIGSKLSKNNSLEIEKSIMITKFKLEKYQNLASFYNEYLRKLAKIRNLVVRREKDELTLEEFKEMNDQFQDEITDLRRLIRNDLVLVDEVKDEDEKQVKLFVELCDKVYEGYHNPETKQRFYSDSQVSYKAIKEKFDITMEHAFEVMEKINKYLKEELDKLL
ncbi:hypothetical protein [Salimicrobium jeotgali]|uniref:hypothetical protein n=1 Tax=Salimicrobium jeotgali TaxID=1230341 RepID=UPI000C837595|nr:hypothetical protein [Salimicrobium jeotgali]